MAYWSHAICVCYQLQDMAQEEPVWMEGRGEGMYWGEREVGMGEGGKEEVTGEMYE